MIIQENDYDLDLKQKSSMLFGNTQTKMKIGKQESLWDNVIKNKYLSDLEKEKKNESIRKRLRQETQGIIRRQISEVNQIKNVEKIQKEEDCKEIQDSYQLFLEDEKARENYIKDQQKMTATIYQ